MFDSNQFFSGGAAGFYPLTIDQSLRFYNNAYLTNTMSSASGTYTVSVWLKRAIITSSQYQYIWSSGAAGLAIGSTAGSVDQFYVYDGSTVQYATPKYRDPSAWYHLVLSVSSNTGVLYVNGESVKTGISCASLSTSANASRIGTYGGGTALPLDGYLAEFHFTDGTAYDADDFGELKSGVWVAKTPSVTYGTNGFYLDFANSADIGNDVSGEGNDWTPNNFTASDVVLDSPTDNFATLNPLDKSGTMTFADGNLQATSSGLALAMGTMAFPSSGKYVFEMKVTSGAGGNFGIARNDVAVGSRTAESIYTCMVRENNTSAWVESVEKTSAWSSTFSPQWVQVRVNMDDGEISWANESEATTTYSFGASTYEWIPFMQTNSDTVLCNFGQSSFVITPPTGFNALSTANLPDPVIDPAQDASPEDYFDVDTYTGTGSSHERSNFTFQPDFLWIKGRSIAENHYIVDAVRGAGKHLRSDQTTAESSVDAGVTSFDSDGFTLGASFQQTNGSPYTYVAWAWKANGSGVTNTDGSITSTVSANTTSGFSIVTYGGNSTAGATVGHGLGSVPDLIIVKNRTGTDGFQNWGVYSSELANTQALFLNTAGAATTNIEYWNNTSPTSDVFSLGYNTSSGWNITGQNFVAYCFHSVEGFSKFGSYVGNGSTDGPFVYTGFRPAFIMWKRTDSSTGGEWVIQDTTRREYNPVNVSLYPNLSNAEATGETFRVQDTLSNGFKLRSSAAQCNASGGTYIYMAFAEDGGPFKYSRAR